MIILTTLIIVLLYAILREQRKAARQRQSDIRADNIIERMKYSGLPDAFGSKR